MKTLQQAKNNNQQSSKHGDIHEVRLPVFAAKPKQPIEDRVLRNTAALQDETVRTAQLAQCAKRMPNKQLVQYALDANRSLSEAMFQELKSRKGCFHAIAQAMPRLQKGLLVGDEGVYQLLNIARTSLEQNLKNHGLQYVRSPAAQRAVLAVSDELFNSLERGGAVFEKANAGFAQLMAKIETIRTFEQRLEANGIRCEADPGKLLPSSAGVGEQLRNTFARAVYSDNKQGIARGLKTLKTIERLQEKLKFAKPEENEEAAVVTPARPSDFESFVDQYLTEKRGMRSLIERKSKGGGYEAQMQAARAESLLKELEAHVTLGNRDAVTSSLLKMHAFRTTGAFPAQQREPVVARKPKQ